MRQNEVKMPFLSKTRTPSTYGSPKNFKINQIKVSIGSDRARTAQNWSEGESRTPMQEALNTWRGRLQHFLQLLYDQKIQKVIII